MPVSEFRLLHIRNEGFQLLNTILEFALGYEVVGRDIFVLYFLQIFIVYRYVLDTHLFVFNILQTQRT